MNRDPFVALADPTRRSILELLLAGPMNVGQIADRFPEVSRVAISKQLKILVQCSAVSASTRGRERWFTASRNGLVPVATWLKAYEAMWNEKLDDLGKHLAKGT